MGLFNVVAPCVVEGKHYVRPTSQPIEVDDETAAPLVEAGSLEPYEPGRSIELLEVPGLVEVSQDGGATWEPEGVTGEAPTAEVPDNEAEPKPRRPRSRRRSGGPDGEAV